MRTAEDLAEAALDLEARSRERVGPFGPVVAALLGWHAVTYVPLMTGLVPMEDVRHAAQSLSIESEGPGDGVLAVAMAGSGWCWSEQVWRSFFSYDMDPSECNRRAAFAVRAEGVPSEHPERVEVRWTVAADLNGQSCAVVRVGEEEPRLAPKPWRGHYMAVWVPHEVEAHLLAALEAQPGSGE